MTRTLDAIGYESSTFTDGAGRTIRSVDKLGQATNFTCDASGNQLSVRDPNNVGQDVVYDALGRAGLTTDTAGDTTNSTYDKEGNRIAAIDGKNATTTYAYDARNRQKSQTDRISGTTNFTYLASGQLASLTDAQSQTTSYTYDNAGNKLTEQYPDHTGGSPGSSTYGIVTFTLDPAGRVLRKQDQAGDTVTYVYDLAGRMTSRDYRTLANSPSGTISDSDTFAYDKASRMLSAVSGRYVNTVGYTYDTAGRKKTESLTISGQTYTVTSGYNSRGELIQLTYPDSAIVERTYTNRGELHQLKHAGSTIDTRSYDNGGRLAGSTYLNGVVESRTYNSDNTLASIGFGGTGTAIGNMTYAWDDNKNKTAESIAGTMTNYGFTIPSGGYDAEDRLVSFNRTSGLTQAWGLSLVGDWNSVTTNGSAQTRTHGPSHELLTGAGQNVTTDVKGNITLIPAALRPNSTALTSTWDFDNRLSSAVSGSSSVSHKYDALGRSVARVEGSSTEVFVPSGQQTIADYTGGTAPSTGVNHYVYASYIDEPVMMFRKSAGGARIYYHRNQQYSVNALTDAAGTVVERYAYTAYGVPTIAAANGVPLSFSLYGNRYTYTGREWDSTIQQYHYRARMYDASLGRFCSKDPIGYAGGENLFVYTSGRPFVGTDPSGFCPCKCAGQTLTLGKVQRDTELEKIRYLGRVVGSAEFLWEAIGSGDPKKCEFKRLVLNVTLMTVGGELVLGGRTDEWKPDDPKFDNTWRGKPTTTITPLPGPFLTWKFNDYDRPAVAALPGELPYHSLKLFINFVVNEDGTITGACCHLSRLVTHIRQNLTVDGSFEGYSNRAKCLQIAKGIAGGSNTKPDFWPPETIPGITQ